MTADELVEALDLAECFTDEEFELEGAMNAIEAFAVSERTAERERVLKLIEADLAKWREYAPRWKLNTAETVLLCASQVDFVIAKIRKGEL